MVIRVLPILLILAGQVVPAAAQFRRGMLADSTEVMLYPHQPPVTLLPAGRIEVELRNATGAPARIVEEIRDLLARQLTENDERLEVVDKGGAVTVTATVVEWNESRYNSTKYVSETRQVGTRQVKDKNGNWKTEPVYEYGRNRPSVVVTAAAGLRMEVRRRTGGTPTVDETARHDIREEYLVDAGPPSRDMVFDMLLDNVVKKAAGKVSPGRTSTRVLLARSDDVDRLNTLALSRKWHDWLGALEALKPHRDKKRDAYRLHNLAVAHEALAYESSAVEDWRTRLGQASTLIGTAAAQNPSEKYITEAATRINSSVSGYSQLAELYAKAGAAPAATARTSTPPATPATTPAAVPAKKAEPPAPAPAPTAPPAAAMSNRDVIDLRTAGLDDDNLIAAVKDAKSVNFDLSPAGLKALLAGKVSNRVITAMRARTQP
jgi:hypothetical protein